MPVTNRLSTMPALPLHRSRLRVPTEISLVGKGRGDGHEGHSRCSHCRRTPLVGEHVHLYGEGMVCQLCRHLRREPPGQTVVVHSSEHLRAVKAAEKLRPRAA
jgi:hypothetical protein